MKNLKLKSGFTLIEVMVALIILAIALTAIVKATGDDVNSVNYLKQRTLAHWIAIDMVRSIQVGLAPRPTPTSPLSGTTTLLNETFYWQVELVKNLFYSTKIKVVVSRNAKAKPLSTLNAFLAPHPGVPA